MLHLKGLVESFPSGSNGLINWLQQAQQIRVFHPIIAHKLIDNNQIQLMSNGNIGSNQQIILVSTEKCFTNVELVGCSTSRAQEIQNSTTIIGHKYYRQDISQAYQASGILKLVLQLFVHKQDQNLPLSPYANHMINQNIISPLQWNKETYSELYSPHLVRLIANTRKQYNQIVEDLKDNKIYGINQQNIYTFMQIVRRNVLCFTPQQPKLFTQDSILITAPIISQVQHSFDPNCAVDGCYLSHENQSFVSLNSIRDISAGEILTINYGNLPNHDYLMRYGFLAKDNQFNQITVDLDFSQHVQFSNELFELKQKLLRHSDIKDIENQIIYSTKINSNLLRHLRIYFMTEEDLQENMSLAQKRFEDFDEKINQSNENTVASFLLINLKRVAQEYQLNKTKVQINTLNIQQLLKYDSVHTHMLDKSIEISLNSIEELKYVQDGEYKNMLQICLEEEDILQKNIKFLQNQLKS